MSNNFDHFDPSEFIQIDELNQDYADYLDSLPPSKSEINFTSECMKCSELITNFELQMNNGHCPNCNSVNIIERRDTYYDHDPENVQELDFDDEEDIPF